MHPFGFVRDFHIFSAAQIGSVTHMSCMQQFKDSDQQQQRSAREADELQTRLTQATAATWQH